ncbi:MAG: hypothetical protein HY939_04270 [Gammaproteobacteria bacterium]|nr:hypothetical protein [Gammaproteobacteria bacterium]
MGLCRRYQAKKLKGDLSVFVDISQRDKLDPVLLHVVLEETRKWVFKSGQPVVSTQRSLDSKRRRAEQGVEGGQLTKRLKSHPYLESPRFDGVDASVTPNPRANDDPNVENALQNELQPRYTPKPSPTFIPPRPRL